MDRLSISPIQDRIIEVLHAWKQPARAITRKVYGIPSDKMPSRSQEETVRQALRSLERKEIVRMSRYIRDRQRCWELTGTAVPLPEKKKEPPKPNGLTIIK